MKKKTVKKVICLSLSGLALFYTVYHIYVFAFPDIKTETVYTAQVFESINADAYIIRDEKKISNDTDGYLNYVLTDGDKVAKDGVIAHVYATEEQGLLKKKAKGLENEIERLENLNSFGIALSTSPSSIERQAYQELGGLIKNVNDNEYQKLSKDREKILYLLNERQIATGQVYSFSDKISELKNNINSLETSSEENLKTVLAKESGYFVGKTDGYEDAFKYDEILNITVPKVNSLISNKKNSGDTCAKIIENAKWYVVCNVKKDDAVKLYVDQYVELSMPLASADRIKAKVAAVNQVDKNSEAAVVFECDYIDKNVLSVRKEPIKINIAEYKGVSVNKKAIHEKLLTKKIIDEETGEERTEEKNVKGVYVRNGKQLVFKEVDIIFSTDDYILCDPKPNKSKLFSDDTIKEYDEIVVKGKKLYDGKMV